MISETLRQFFRSRVQQAQKLVQRNPNPRTGPVAPPSYPLDLSRDQVESLRQLQSTPQWRTYTEALSRVYELEAGTLFRGIPHDRYLAQTGVCQGLEMALGLITKIDTQARSTDDHTSNRPAPKPPSPFFGGPWYEHSIPKRN